MSSKTSGERRRAEHLGPELRRPLVLDAALTLFAEHGYLNTSMDSIAEAAGVTKPVLYDCFSSKEALYEALVEREDKRVQQQVVDAFPKNPDLSDIEQLIIDGCTASLKAVAANPASWKAAYAAEHGASPDIAQRVQRIRQAQIDRIAQLATEIGSRQGLPRPDRAATVIAHAINAAGDAAAKLMLAEPDRWSPDEVGEILGRFFARGARGFSG